jgi:probable DNA metabolism protein
MESPAHLLYDGSFDGFLSVVFNIYEHKVPTANIQPASRAQAGLFQVPVSISTNESHAHRVWKKLVAAARPSGAHLLYRAFLSERDGIENLLLLRIRDIIAQGRRNASDYSDPTVLELAQVAKMVGREKHRMEAFVRFKLTKDGIYFAIIEPDFNVLPLIAKHFKNRYADQQWLIFDKKRGAGLYYDETDLSEVTISLNSKVLSPSEEKKIYTAEELEFQQLWATYFEKTNIASRRNMKLHKRHVPLRYWKYLSEKSLQLKK